MGFLRKLSMANCRRAVRYWKKNGFSSMFYAALERLETSRLEEYVPKTPDESTLEEQRTYAWKQHRKISILVPAFETKEEYLQQMIDSVLAQTYYDWELVIADASATNRVEEVLQQYEDVRVKHIRLKTNRGISENSNEALQYATGDYIALLDHDDIITPDTLYEVMKRIEIPEENGVECAEAPVLIYTDEDKVNEKLTSYFEPHYKREFNLDLFLSNNYICHFTVIKASYARELGFRQAYDGAQDYDLFLRVVARLMKENRLHLIEHVDKVLYHWRCHKDSTSENPDSKFYAYEAGRKAIEDFVRLQGWDAEVLPTEHLGFYRLKYPDGDLFSVRRDVAITGGNLVHNKKIVGGAMLLDGTPLFQGLSVHFSGYMHRAVLCQEVDALDIRCMRVSQNPEHAAVKALFLEYLEKAETGGEAEIRKMSLQLCQMAREAGFRILFQPEMERIL